MKSKIKTNPSRKVFLAFNAVFFVAIILVCAYPIWYVFIQSVSDSKRAVNAIILPVGATLQNYVELLSNNEIFSAAAVSVLRTVLGTTLTVCTTLVLGYVFSKQEMPFRRVMYRILIITMYISGGLIPTYLVYKAYGLLNNFWVYILPSMVSAYYTILVKTYIEGLPASVEESAMIDGAGTLTIIARIIAPMALPSAATIAIYASVGQWNAWFDNQIYTVASKELTTLQYLLYTYLNQSEQLLEQVKKNGGDLGSLLTPRGIKMTVTMITVVPILCVYPLLQRYLIQGLTIGAVKG